MYSQYRKHIRHIVIATYSTFHSLFTINSHYNVKYIHIATYFTHITQIHIITVHLQIHYVA